MSAKPSLQKQVSDCELCYCHANPFFFSESLSPIFVFASCRKPPANSSLISQQFTSAHHLVSSMWCPSLPIFSIPLQTRDGFRVLEKQLSAGTLQAGSKTPGLIQACSSGSRLGSKGSVGKFLEALLPASQLLPNRQDQVMQRGLGPRYARIASACSIYSVP